MKLKLTFIALFFVLFINAQTPIIFESSKTQSYLLNYTNGGGEKQRYINEMIQIISSYMHKSVYKTRITFSCDENVKITKVNHKLSILVSYDNIRISGDNFYKGFDISDELIPSEYDFDAILSRKNGVELKKYSFSENHFSPRNNETAYNYTDTLQNAEYKFIINERNFIFNRNSLHKFISKTTIIDKYYQADNELNLYFNELQNINTNNFEQVEQVQQIINNLITRFSNIEHAEFWTVLNIHIIDPVNLKAKMQAVRKNIDEKQNNINYTRSIIHSLYFEKGLDEYKNNRRNLARNDFSQALVYSPQYPQPQYYLSLMSYEDNNVNEAMTRLISLFSLSNVDRETWEQAVNLAKYVESAKIKETQKQISQNYFQEALLSLDKISSFCKNIRDYYCNDSINILRANCHNNIYQKLIFDAQSDYQVERYNDAIIKIDKALNYQSQFAGFVNSNNQAILVKQQIKADYYLLLVKNGKISYYAKNYYDAFANFNNAYEIEKSYTVNKDIQLLDLIKNSKLELLLIDINNAEKIVLTNDLKKARLQLMKIIQEQQQYFLNDNDRLIAKIESLRNSIFSQQCKIAQTNYDNNTANAQNRADVGAYIDAIKFFKQAIAVSESNIDCQLNIDFAKNAIQTYQPPAKYQEDFVKCNKLVTLRNYSEATLAYINLDKYYYQNNLEIFKIEHKPLHLFISQYNTDYIMYGATYFVNNIEFKNAFYLLKQLKSKNFNRSKTKSIQVALACAYAVSDFKENPNLNSKLKVAEYTQTDKWFKFFNKEYLKQIKKLK